MGMGMGGGGGALLGDCSAGSVSSVCVEIDAISCTRSVTGGGGGTLVGEIGVRGGLKGSSKV